MSGDLSAELRRLSKSWARAKAREQALAAEAAQAARKAVEEGCYHETELADLFSVDRGTVRGWLGKKRIRRHCKV